MQIITGKQEHKKRTVIYGPEGIGKSTLASQFPNPVFLDIEQGTLDLDVSRTPAPQSFAEFREQIKQVAGMGFGTIVIDTADALEALASAEVCAAHGKAGIEEFGYGKGMVYLAETWGKLLNYLSGLTESANVVLLAHAAIRKFELPEEAGAYDRWELNLSKRCAALTKEWADAVLFLNYQTIVLQSDSGKGKASGGKRVVYTSHHPTRDAKNRWQLPDQFDLADAWQHIAPHIPTGTPIAASHKPQPEPQPEPVTDPTPEPEPTPEPAATAPATIPRDKNPAFPVAMWNLMEAQNITEEQISAYITHRGHYPEGTDFHAVPQEYWDMVVANWDKVITTIKEMA
jgi:hypothetical protein